MHRHILALGLVIGSWTAAGIGGQSPAPKPATQQEIAQWIKDLNNDEFQVRENASRRLRETGAPAQAALEEAALQDEPEVKRRALEILEDFRWGIYPDTPARVADHIRQYKGAADANAKVTIGRALFDLGDPGRKALVHMAKAEPDKEMRRQLFQQLAIGLPQATPGLLLNKQHQLLEDLLEYGSGAESLEACANLAAYWHLRGQGNAKIKDLENQLKNAKSGPGSWEALTFLYRAKGDAAACLRAAQTSGRAELLEGILQEQGQWKLLADQVAGRSSSKEILGLGFLAATQRLAGNTKALAETFQEIRNTAPPKTESDPASRQAAKAFFLNEEPDQGLEWLAKSGHFQAAVEVLLAQSAYHQAFALVNRPTTDEKLRIELTLLKARCLFTVGEKAKALELFRSQGELIDPEKHSSWYELQIWLEHRLGLNDLAFEHAARLLARSQVAGLDQRIFGRLNPTKGALAAAWWKYLRSDSPNEAPGKTMARLTDLMAGKIGGEEFKRLATGLEASVKTANSRAQATGLMAIADVAQTLHEEIVQEQYLIKALEVGKTPSLLIQRGDLFASKKDWTQAAKTYREAWDQDNLLQLPLFLQGWALAQAGSKAESQEIMELAHWLPLAQSAGRSVFSAELMKRGFPDDARRERDLILQLGVPATLTQGQAQLLKIPEAVAAKEYAKAATCQEQALLPVLSSHANFLDNQGYVVVPYRIHLFRSRAALAAGKYDEALKEAQICRKILPLAVEPATTLIPELSRNDRKNEADELFNSLTKGLKKVCDDYPQNSGAHNSMAWLLVNCRRQFETAKKHAEKAVALEPENAGYLDTLAEITFQQGDKAGAVLLMKKCVELNPKRAYFARQLKRIEAGDKEAPLPDE